MRSPATMAGKEAGSSTCTIVRRLPVPSICAASIYVRSTKRAPRYALMRQGGKAPENMIRIGPPSPVPNQRAANGTQAIGEMNLKPSKTGVIISSSQRNQPMSNPRGTPTATAREKPDAKRSKLRARCTGRLAPANGSQSKLKVRNATSQGVGRNCRGTNPEMDTATQIATKQASPVMPRRNASTFDGRGLLFTSIVSCSNGKPRHEPCLDASQNPRRGPSENSDRDHADQHHRRIDVGLSHIEHAAKASDRPDQLSRNERGPGRLQ